MYLEHYGDWLCDLCKRRLHLLPDLGVSEVEQLPAQPGLQAQQLLPLLLLHPRAVQVGEPQQLGLPQPDSASVLGAGSAVMSSSDDWYLPGLTIVRHVSCSPVLQPPPLPGSRGPH